MPEVFDHETMWMLPASKPGDERYVEGYFEDPNVNRRTGGKVGYPELKAHSAPWPGQEAWLRYLAAVELKTRQRGYNHAGSPPTGDVLQFFTAGDHSWCRLCGSSAQPDADHEERIGDRYYRRNGIGEFQARLNGIWYYWPEGYRHYIVEHNCMPSRQFYHLIPGIFSRL